jgi:CDGSH-type Zn-finger protein
LIPCINYCDGTHRRFRSDAENFAETDLIEIQKDY